MNIEIQLMICILESLSIVVEERKNSPLRFLGLCLGLWIKLT